MRRLLGQACLLLLVITSLEIVSLCNMLAQYDTLCNGKVIGMQTFMHLGLLPGCVPKDVATIAKVKHSWEDRRAGRVRLCDANALPVAFPVTR